MLQPAILAMDIPEILFLAIIVTSAFFLSSSFQRFNNVWKFGPLSSADN